MQTLPPSPAALVGRMEHARHPKASIVTVTCRYDPRPDVRCLVGVELHDGTRRCAVVRLDAWDGRWRLAAWQSTVGCPSLRRAAWRPGEFKLAA